MPVTPKKVSILGVALSLFAIFASAWVGAPEDVWTDGWLVEVEEFEAKPEAQKIRPDEAKPMKAMIIAERGDPQSC